MTFTTPNSAGFADIDEANTEGTHAYLMRGARKRKRKVREFNSCHDPASGRFCSDRRAEVSWQRTLRRTNSGKRADRVMSRLESQMKNLAKNRPWVIYDHVVGQQSRVSRALTLRKRMDVAGPLAYRQRKNSFVGTFKRIFSNDPNYRGKKR